MAKYVDVEGVGLVEFPDDWSDAQVKEYADSDAFMAELEAAGVYTPEKPSLLSSATQSGFAQLQRTTGMLYGYLTDDKENAARLIVEQSKRLKEIGVPKGVQEVYQSVGFGDTLINLIQNSETIPYTVIQSLVQFAPVLAAAAPQLAMAGPTFGVTGFTGVATIGAGSLALEAGHTMLEEWDSQGIDSTNYDQVLAAFNNPTLMEIAKDRGLAKGLPIAIFDMASAGVAGRIFKAGRRIARGIVSGFWIRFIRVSPKPTDW